MGEGDYLTQRLSILSSHESVVMPMLNAGEDIRDSLRISLSIRDETHALLCKPVQRWNPDRANDRGIRPSLCSRAIWSLELSQQGIQRMSKAGNHSKRRIRLPWLNPLQIYIPTVYLEWVVCYLLRCEYDSEARNSPCSSHDMLRM